MKFIVRRDTVSSSIYQCREIMADFDGYKGPKTYWKLEYTLFTASRTANFKYTLMTRQYCRGKELMNCCGKMLTCSKVTVIGFSVVKVILFLLTTVVV
jgi:hypothetical protein